MCFGEGGEGGTNIRATKSVIITTIAGKTSANAATRPANTASQVRTHTNMAKLTELGFPEKESWIAFPIRAVVMRTRMNCTARRAACGRFMVAAVW